MSHANMFSPFSDAIFNAIRNESLETEYDYVIGAGAVVVCPLPTSCAFLRKFSPSLMSDIMLHLIYW